MDLINSKITILIVDDEPFIRKSVRELLEDEGYTVTEAGNSSGAMKILEDREIDIVLMDIQMPGTDGMETLKTMAQKHPGVDTIMISGHGNIETAVEALKFGANDFLEKPFSSVKLKEAVGAVVKKREQLKNLERMKKHGTAIGKYIINKEIASGATAALYRTTQQGINKTVALKILHPHLTASGSFAKRFQREAIMTAQLSHPNIVQIFDYGREGNLFYIAMEYIEGHSLEKHCEEDNRLSLADCSAAGIKICRALEHAHAKGVIHRDIKPQNVLMADDGTIKLVDFGLARSLDPEMSIITQPEKAIGTPQYMSPEQIEGKEIGPASDIFSLGTLLYLITTLHFPFPGPNLASIFYAIIEGKYQHPFVHNKNIGLEMDRIIIKCLQRVPEERYASAAELRNDLERTVAGGQANVFRQDLTDYQ
jgi:serine/threonine protein kinase